MPVTGNEEPGVLSRQSSDISSGIPLKKRRFLLVQPPSPPHQETPPALSEENDVKKIEKSASDMNKEESSSDFKKNEESGSDLMSKEESCSDVKKKEEYCSDMMKKEESGLEFKGKEESESDLKNKGESGTNLKNKEETNSEQTSLNANSVNISPATLDVSKNCLDANLDHLNADFAGSKLPEASHLVNLGSVNKLNGRTKFLLTEESASQEVPGMTSIKEEILIKQVEEDCKLKLSSGSGNDELALQPSEPLVPGVGNHNTTRNSKIPDKLDNSLLSLSLGKNNSVVDEKISDPRLDSVTNHARANRSNWDLNTTMDAWEGSAGDAAFKVTVDTLRKTTVSTPSLSSTPLDSIGRNKGKQVIAADDQRSGFPISSVLPSHPSEDSLRLTLSMFSRGSSVKVDSRMGGSISNLRNTLVSTVTANSPSSGTIKSEPIDENSKNASVGASGSPLGLLDFSSVKREPIEKQNKEAVKLSANSSQKLIKQESIKSESLLEVTRELCRTEELTSQQSLARVVHFQESAYSSSVQSMPLTPQNPSPSRLVTSSALSASIDVSNQSEHSVHTKEGRKCNDALDQAAADMVSKPVPKGGEAKVHGWELDTFDTVVQSVDSEMSGSKIINENSHGLRASGEGSVSGEEKINFSAEIMDDESYGSECESDGNQALSHLDVQDRCARDDDDYEDGEVREPLVHSTLEDPIAEGMDTESVKLVDHDIKDNPAFGFAGDSNTDQFHLVHKDNEKKVHDDKTVDCNDCIVTASNESNGQLTDKDDALQKLLPDEIATTGADEKWLSNPTRRKPLDQHGKKSVLEGNEKDIPCGGTTSSGQRTVTTMGRANGENVKLINMAEKPDSSFPEPEGSLNGNDAAKDSISGGNRSRIINLPRASVTSPCKTRSIPDRSLSFRSGTEKYSGLDGDRYLLRGKKDEVETHGPQRFIRERIHDQSFRNSRLNYTRGRGRFSGRLGTSRSEWDRESEFTFHSYNDNYRFTRNKRASAMTDTELESNGYVIAPDGAALSTSRGRKPLNDDLPSFRHPRRLSRGGRDGPTTRDFQILRRIPRNVSPSRRNDENAGEWVGLRHDEKFVRTLPNDILDPGYTPQSTYEGGDGQFVRGNRNFSAIQRRGFPQIRSKSPVGPRTRSPGPWSSPQKRSPDGFNGISQLNRSATLSGIERMRSPDRSCFPEEMITRRRSSPSYIARPSNDMRDVDSAREHGHPRPINSNRRTPSDQVFSRSTRRLDVLDPRIRMGEEEFFGRSAHSNRSHEFHGDGSSDERRKCSERRGLIRSFRPPYIGEGDNLRFHLDDVPKPFRFCSEGDTEFVGRSMREREFEGRIRTRPTVGTRRIRSIDEQEGNYRHNAQVWNDDGFNEASGFKRRRF